MFVPPAFHIDKRLHRNRDVLPFAEDFHFPLPFSADLQCVRKIAGQFLIEIGLGKIPECVDFISFGRIFVEVCHKNQHGFGIMRPHTARQIDAVLIAQINVQKEDVVLYQRGAVHRRKIGQAVHAHGFGRIFRQRQNPLRHVLRKSSVVITD